MRWGEATRWLLFEGVLPLLGASVLFLVWGVARKVTHSAATMGSFQYAWKEALDPMGWLYGVSILAMQSAKLSYDSHNYIALTGFLAAGFASLVFLLSSMTNRGAFPKWSPPLSTQVVTGVLVAVVLAGGYLVNSRASKDCIKPNIGAGDKHG